MEIDYSKLLSLLAIVISVLTVIMTKENLKKQLRLSKLEEILEILNYFYGYYDLLYNLYNKTDELTKKEIIHSSFEIEELAKRRDTIVSIIGKENMINKVSRLRILSNAYLNNSNNLKSKIIAVGNIYYKIYIYSHSKGQLLKSKEGQFIPTPNEMHKLLSKIESDVIKEMNLGYKSIDKNSHDNYLKTKFKKDFESE